MPASRLEDATAIHMPASTLKICYNTTTVQHLHTFATTFQEQLHETGNTPTLHCEAHSYIRLHCTRDATATHMPACLKFVEPHLMATSLEMRSKLAQRPLMIHKADLAQRPLKIQHARHCKLAQRPLKIHLEFKVRLRLTRNSNYA